jgi:LacI family transcriptional regulator, galactose operon repressor
MANLVNKALFKHSAYTKMNEDIINAIKRNELRPGEGLLSKRQLAKTYGISYVTVHRGIKKLVDNGYLITIPQKGIFVSAKTESNTSLKKVGLYLPSLKISINMRILTGVEDELRKKNMQFFLVNGDLASDQGNIENLKKLLHTTDLDGLIILGTIAKDDFYEIKYLRPKMKIMLLGGNMRFPETDCIKCDNEGGAYLATDHLIQRGCNNVVFLGSNKKHETSLERLSGYLKAMKIHHLEPRHFSGNYSYECGRNAIGSLLESGHVFDGLVCFTDLVAMGAISRLDEEGIKVPQDVLVTGFSNLTEAQYYAPPITTISVDYMTMARQAVNKLGEKKSGKQEHIEIILPVKLIVRKSTTCNLEEIS